MKQEGSGSLHPMSGANGEGVIRKRKLRGLRGIPVEGGDLQGWWETLSERTLFSWGDNESAEAPSVRRKSGKLGGIFNQEPKLDCLALGREAGELKKKSSRGTAPQRDIHERWRKKAGKEKVTEISLWGKRFSRTQATMNG